MDIASAENIVKGPIPFDSEHEFFSAEWPEKIPITQHGELYCSLPKDSAVKGNWIADKVPAVQPLLEWVLNPGIQSIAVCKNSQGGISVACQVIVGYFIEQEPSPIMVILADQETAEFMSDNRYQWMFQCHDRYNNLRNPNQWTKTRMSFLNGAYLEMGWASSVAKMGSRSIRIAIADEVDKPGYNIITAEGATIKLPESRLKTYYELSNAKYIKLSTPTIETGNIAKEVQQADIIFDWHVPCPHCGQKQPLNWHLDAKRNYWFQDGLYLGADGKQHPLGCVTWDGGRNATNEQILTTTRYRCGACNGLWTEQERKEAISQGIEIPRTRLTGYERRYAICYSDLISKLTSMEKLVEEWIAAFRIESRLERDKAIQDFINSKLGEPYKQVTIQSTEASILKARVDLDPQLAPDGTVALTCGVDCQAYGFYFTVWAWQKDYASYLIHYGMMQTWEELGSLLFESSYNGISIWRAAIDTGGGKTEHSDLSMTEAAYWWILQNRFGANGCKVWGTKGSSSPMATKIRTGNVLQKTPSGKNLPGGLQLVILNTDKLKDLLIAYRLAHGISGEGDQPAYLHRKTEVDFARHLTAEVKERDNRGVESWTKKRDDNHWLDACVIAHALADPEWPTGGINMLVGATRPAPQVPKPERDITHLPAAQNVMQPVSSVWQDIRSRRINPRMGR